MRIKREDRSPVSILHLHGRLVGGPDSDAFDEAVDKLVRESRLLCVVDFQHVDFVSSPGIGYLFRNYAHHVNAGGVQVAAHMNSRIAIIYELFLKRVFEYFETVDEAVEYLLNKSEIEQN